jgi:hypothetical protein
MRALPVRLLCVVAAVLLFVVQFYLIGRASVFPESGWLADPAHLHYARFLVRLNVLPLVQGAVPSMLLAYLVARGIERTVRSQEGAGSLAGQLVVAWATVWVIFWVALFAFFAGTNPARWSTNLITQPAFWYTFVVVAGALYVGARRPEEPRRET